MSGIDQPLSESSVRSLREHWRELKARRGRPLEHLLALHEQLPGNAVGQLLERWRKEPPAAEELTDKAIQELRQAGEPSVPMYYAWQLRFRDGEVTLMRHRDRELPPPERSGKIAGHAMRPAEMFSWQLVNDDAELITDPPVVKQVIAEIARRHPEVAHKSMIGEPAPETDRVEPELKATPGELVYGEINEGLVFIPRAEAEELAELYSALRLSTWGQLRRAVSGERWRDILDRVGVDEGSPPPGDGDELQADSIPGFADQDWPAWPAQRMGEWLPRDVLDRYGRLTDTLLSGTFTWFDPSSAGAIVRDLERLGWTCEEDQGLVEAASGH